MVDAKKSKFDLSGVIESIQESLGDDTSTNIGTGADIGDISDNPGDYVVMPDWFKTAYGVMGLQFGRIAQWAGDSDSGKTTFAMQAIKAAQDQGHMVLYVETEGKTPVEYFHNWEIDPKGVLLVQSKFTEHAFTGAFTAIDKFFEQYPNEKLLMVFDSYGNTSSIRDEDANDMTNESRVGGAAKVNRRALNVLVAKMQKHPITALIINYTYDNIGSVGKTNAGGKALNFFSTLIVQTQRAGWIEGTVKGEKVSKGAKVGWRTTKNHYAQALKTPTGEKLYLPTKIELSITDEGLKVL